MIFAALSTLGIRPKVAVPASLFALVPDFDAILGIHRWFLHSIVVLIAVGFPVVLLLRRTRLRSFAPLALLAALSHPILDTFWGYTPIFWPVFMESVWINLGMSLKDGGSLGIGLDAEVLTEPTTFEPPAAFDAPLLTGTGLAISALLVLPVLLATLRGRKP